MRFWILFVAAALAIGGTVQAADGTELPELRLQVEPDEGIYRVWLEVIRPTGEIERNLLRETPVEPVPGPTGWDPTGTAAFANWTEEAATWSAYSRDGAASWAEARPLRVELLLRDGATAPGAPLPPPAPGLAAPDGARVFLVQFRTLGLPEWREALRAAGAEVLNFFPHNAHVVRMDPSALPAITSLDFVERAESYHPSYRLEPELRSWLGGNPDPRENDSGELRVWVLAFESGPDPKQRILAAAEAAGARVADYWPSGHVLELWVGRDQLPVVAAHDDVLWIDRWTPRETDMDLVREDAGTNWVENNFGYCGQDVRGEVMDSGIEQGHMDFSPPGVLMHTGADLASHGTSTYGIVFGNGDRDGDGQAKGTGHMPCDQAQGIFADYGYVSDRFAHTQELKDAPYFASFQTNSWGNARTTSYTSVSFDMDDIIWKLDIAITQSQSNAGNQNSRPQAWAKNIVSVGGIRHYDTLDTSDDAWNFGASIGPAADGRIKPDLNYWYDSIYTTTTGNSYTSGFGGTSAATPEVAGVLGLMVQMWADNVWGTDPVGGSVFEKQPHFSTIKALLVNNAQQYPFSGTGHDLTRTHQGWGRPSARLAKERAASSFVVDEEEPLQVGGIVGYDVDVAPGESELKVTMVYPDPPGTTSSTLHRINDVNLKVTSPSATVYHGNVGLDAANYSAPGGGPNGVDTVENVFVENPEAGQWRIEVEAAEVNQDAYTPTPEVDVAFALVVTGAVLDAGDCGNGVREGSEDCDGSDLGGATCSSEGCQGGILGCTVDCEFDFTACTGCPSCDFDGACETFEDCNTCPDDCRSGSGAECGNGVCEAADGEDCLSCSIDCNGVTSGKPSGRFCCGSDVANCDTDPRCNTGGNTCTEAPTESCCGDGTCEGDEDSLNCEIDCGPVPDCPDGQCDPNEDSCSCPEDCGIPPSSEDVATTCDDGIDNDCDGAADCDDVDCGGHSSCVCEPLGASCVYDFECCSRKCLGAAGKKVCK